MGTTSTSTSTSTAIGGAQPPTPNELDEVALPSIPVDSVDPNPAVAEGIQSVVLDNREEPTAVYDPEDMPDPPVRMDEEDTPALPEDEPEKPKRKRFSNK